MLLTSYFNTNCKLWCTSKHTVVCQQPRKQKKTCDTHASVSLTGTTKLPNSAFHISKTSKPISTKFIYFLPYIYATSHIKIEEHHFKIFVPENCPIFFTFSSFYIKLQIYLTCVKITFSCFNFFQIWNTNNAYLGLESKKDWGSYDIIS